MGGAEDYYSDNHRDIHAVIPLVVLLRRHVILVLCDCHMCMFRSVLLCYLRLSLRWSDGVVR